MDLYSDITQRIDTFYKELKQNNPLFIAIFSGTIKPEQLQFFLGNITHNMAQGIESLAMAKNASQQRGDTKFTEYYANRFHEECHHVAWAEADEEKIKEITQSTPDIEPDSALVDMTHWFREKIKEDPAIFMAYSFFAEYFTVISGEESAHAIENKCQIPASCINNITTHAEIDKHHIEDWREDIKQLIDEETYRDAFIQATEYCMQQYDSFCRNIMEIEIEAVA